MNENETAQAAGCPVLSYSPHERWPIGEWAAFFDQLRADCRLADGAVIFEVGRSSGPDSVPLRWNR